MKYKLLTKYDRLEQSRKSLIGQIEMINEQMLNIPPHKGKWSANQIIFHLLTSESGSLNYVKKKMQSDKLTQNGYASKLGSLALKIALKLPLKYKAPKAALIPPENLDFNTLKNEWEETRNSLKNLIESLPEEMLNKNIHRHPFAGRFNLSQMMTFFQDHFDHHRPQIIRIIKNSS